MADRGANSLKCTNNVGIFRKYDGVLYGQKLADPALMRIRLNIVSLSRRSMDKDKLLLDYLKALLDRYGKYHDHKELSAWAGIVLYFVFCVAILRVEISTSP